RGSNILPFSRSVSNRGNLTLPLPLNLNLLRLQISAFPRNQLIDRWFCLRWRFLPKQIRDEEQWKNAQQSKHRGAEFEESSLVKIRRAISARSKTRRICSTVSDRKAY